MKAEHRSVAEVAQAFVDGAEGKMSADDFATYFAPTVDWWRSTDDEPFPPIAGAQAAAGRVSDGPIFRELLGENALKQTIFLGEHGFAVERLISGTLEDGTHISVPCCEVCTVENGVITKFALYVDRQHHRPLVRELLKHRGDPRRVQRPAWLTEAGEIIHTA